MADHALPAGYDSVRSYGAGGFAASVAPIFVDRTGHRMAFRASSQHANRLDRCHGGALATFADAQAIIVTDLASIPEDAVQTINLTMDYMKPVKLGDFVEMEVALTARTGSHLFSQGIIKVSDEVVARATVIYRYGDKRS